MNIKEVVGINGPFARFGTLLFDMLLTNILWLIFGGPALMLLLRMIPATPETLSHLLDVRILQQ